MRIFIGILLGLNLGLYFEYNMEKYKTPSIQEQIDDSIKLAAHHYKIDENIIRAVIKVESKFKPNAIGKHGEIGLLQIMPIHKPEFDIRKNIFLGTKLLKKSIKNCKHKKNFTWLVCYNAGITGGSKIKNPSKFTYYKKVMSHVYE